MKLHKEGTLTRLVERQTSKMPSMLFLTAAGVSIIGSLVSFISGRKQFANLVGEWVPTFLLLGMYNKFVKEAT
jgi:hypothetical protein